jgi:hypothetical protein
MTDFHFLRIAWLLLIPIAVGLWWAWRRNADPLVLALANGSRASCGPDRRSEGAQRVAGPRIVSRVVAGYHSNRRSVWVPKPLPLPTTPRRSC